ncbi:MAG: helix-turn-helix transcriptional regulator, partial [Steroidobacteraceae bacterium]|nr:helix-turn-helix transcriptional regulator [Steroidobacteraceae bacterium]
AGTTFLELREAARYDTACHLLRNTRMPVSEIASTLGYAECSSFTRAFGRWAGAGPAEWRGRHTRSAAPRRSLKAARAEVDAEHPTVIELSAAIDAAAFSKNWSG